jgi:hypothetical protein
MTPDARRVAFVSRASNLIVADTNTIADVFLHDLETSTTVAISQGAVAPEGNRSYSTAPVITPDGRFVAFYSTATNLVPGVGAVGEMLTCESLLSAPLLGPARAPARRYMPLATFPMRPPRSR